MLCVGIDLIIIIIIYLTLLHLLFLIYLWLKFILQKWTSDRQYLISSIYLWSCPWLLSMHDSRLLLSWFVNFGHWRVQRNSSLQHQCLIQNVFDPENMSSVCATSVRNCDICINNVMLSIDSISTMLLMCVKYKYGRRITQFQEESSL